MPVIACLHTAASNVGVFDAALHGLRVAGAGLRHAVRPDLLAAAERAGGPTPEIIERTATALRSLCDGADAVLLTCSTLGFAAAMATTDAPAPVLQADAALAQAAVRDGGRVAVLCAAPTTLEPTRRLSEAASAATGAEIRMRLVPDAWGVFKAGDHRRYLALIAAAADAALEDGASRVALAQASMAGAAPLCASPALVDTSPAVALAAALLLIGR